MSRTVLHQIVEASPLVGKTRAMYLHDLDRWCDFAGDDPRGWNRYKAQEFYNELLKTMQPQSANRMLGGIAYATKWWSIKEGNPQLDFAVVQKTKAAGKSQRYALKPAEATALLATCRLGADWTSYQKRDLAMLVVGLETGMRCMSIAGMTMENLTTEKSYGYPIARVPIKGKGADFFEVPLSDLAVAAIAPWRAWLATRGVKSGPLFRGIAERHTREKPWVTWLINPRQLTETAIYQIVVKRGKTAKLDHHIHPHILRHTFVTWRADAGMQPHQIASITGHDVSGLPGMSGLGHYYDVAKVGSEARNSTPTWLTDAVTPLLNEVP